MRVHTTKVEVMIQNHTLSTKNGEQKYAPLRSCTYTLKLPKAAPFAGGMTFATQISPLLNYYLIPVILEEFQAFKHQECFLFWPVSWGCGRRGSLQGCISTIVLISAKTKICSNVRFLDFAFLCSGGSNGSGGSSFDNYGCFNFSVLTKTKKCGIEIVDPRLRDSSEEFTFTSLFSGHGHE